MDAFELETGGALDPGIRKSGWPKRKELEKLIYVHLSEDHSDPELMAHKHRPISRTPSTVVHIGKVNNSSILNVTG